MYFWYLLHDWFNDYVVMIHPSVHRHSCDGIADPNACAEVIHTYSKCKHGLGHLNL
jgi:hypothetical protein